MRKFFLKSAVVGMIAAPPCVPQDRGIISAGRIPRMSNAGLFDPSLARKAARTLARTDSRLAGLCRKHGTPRLAARRPGGAFAFLVRSVLNQQLAVAAAAAIGARVRERVCAGGPPTARALLDAGSEGLRSCGVSGPKARTLLGLAEAEHSGRLKLRGLSRLEDESVIEGLSELHGIGRWTAQMFLIFHLGRADVFPETDLAVVDELGRLLELGERPKARQASKLAEPWTPYRSVVAWWLWRERSGRAPGIR
jgi:DNA-3-methyladenine glycosylase II